VPATVATQLGAYLNQLPWLLGGGGLDWSQMKGSKVDLSTLTESQRRERRKWWSMLRQEIARSLSLIPGFGTDHGVR